MQIFDISMTVSAEMPVYKGKPAKKPKITIDSDFQTGTAYESRLEMNMHTGTHLDMPLHMVEGGKDLDSLDLAQVITRCKVLDVTSVEGNITREHLSTKEIAPGDFVLLKTRNSFEPILEGDFIYVDKTGAALLAEKRIKGVGIDALGIERGQPDHETHMTLLHAGIIILEGLTLKGVEEGEYLLFAAPVKVAGVEAAPVRAVLIR